MPDADRRESAWPLRKAIWGTGSHKSSDGRVERLFNGFWRSLFYNSPLVKNGYPRCNAKDALKVVSHHQDSDGRLSV
jgi:hypothetical protein